jgi:hypothetical protein
MALQEWFWDTIFFWVVVRSRIVAGMVFEDFFYMILREQFLNKFLW